MVESGCVDKNIWDFQRLMEYSNKPHQKQQRKLGQPVPTPLVEKVKQDTA